MPKFEFEYEIINSDQLSKGDQELVVAAKRVIGFSHSPYSEFRVSSAVEMQDGSVVTGTNQENAAYPSGLCAERVALFSAKSQSRMDIRTIIVHAELNPGTLADAYPCGGCRQVMLEYASQQKTAIRLLLRQSDGNYIVLKDARDLLPFSFTSKMLK